MYITGVEVTITWEILPHATPPSLSSLSIFVIDPEGYTNFYPSSIDIADYTAPADVSPGHALYRITPTMPGLWKVGLCIGDEDNYQILGQADMFVFDAITSTPEIRVSTEWLQIPIEWQLEYWDNNIGEPSFWEYSQALDEWHSTATTTSTGYFIPINDWNIGYRESSVPIEVITLGSEIPNDLTFIEITDDNDVTIGQLEVLPSITPVGYDIDEEVPLNFTGADDIQHLVISGSKDYDYVFEDNLDGFILTSKLFTVKDYGYIDSQLFSVGEAANIVSIDNTISSFYAISVNLRTALKSYDTDTDDNVTSEFSALSGSLYVVNQVFHDYEFDPESVDSSFISVSGDLYGNLITYEFYESENVTSQFISVSGSLT